MLLKEAHTTHMGYETHATIIIQQSVPSSPDVPDELEKGDTARWGLDEVPKGAISPLLWSVNGFELHIWSQGLCGTNAMWVTDCSIYMRYKILHLRVSFPRLKVSLKCVLGDITLRISGDILRHKYSCLRDYKGRCYSGDWHKMVQFTGGLNLSFECVLYQSTWRT